MHILGSPSDDFSFKITLLYGGSFSADMGNGKYRFSYAIARPDGTWSFVEKLSSIIDVEKREEKKNDVERVDLKAALQRINAVIKPDLALIHFVCYKGTTIYRSDIYILHLFHITEEMLYAGTSHELTSGFRLTLN